MDEKDLEGAPLARVPLTDAEVDEVREWVETGAADTTMPVSFLALRLLRLLAEVKAARAWRKEAESEIERLWRATETLSAALLAARELGKR